MFSILPVIHPLYWSPADSQCHVLSAEGGAIAEKEDDQAGQQQRPELTPRGTKGGQPGHQAGQRSQVKAKQEEGQAANSGGELSTLT